MGYKNAEKLLPPALLKAVQQYAEGECIYIPRSSPLPRRPDPGITQRNAQIRAQYTAGRSARSLAEEHHLSLQSIYKILSTSRK